MPTADKVIIELEARVSKAEADIRRYKSTTEGSLKAVEQASARAAKKQEMEFKRAARAIKAEQTQIGASMKALGASIATYFTGNELIKLADGFTRVQNALKVAGLEGAALKGVQGQLLGQSQKYGVGLEELARLYGNVSQSAKELGASSSDIINLTEYTAQSLKISGTSAVAASGAILGLNQALASARVSTEEFNQMNEGGLRPLLQAAANSEKFGGSVSKLRNYMKETGISGAELFRLINDGAGELETKSNKAVLTLSGGFQALTSSIMVYMGEADAANGVSAALGAAMVAVSENLDVLADAITVVAIGMGVKMVAGAVAGSGALRAVAAYAAVASTGLAGTALAARSAGAALLTALGGPVGAAILAVAAALGYLATRESEADQAAIRLNSAMQEGNAARAKAIDISNKYARAIGAERAEIEKTIHAELRLAKARLAAARSEVASALARNNTEAASTKSFIQSFGTKGTAQIGLANRVKETQAATASLRAATDNLNAQKGVTDELVNALKGGGQIGGIQSSGAPPAGDGKGKKTKAPKGVKDTGPSAAEIESQHQSDLRRIRAEILQSELNVVNDAEKRREISKELDQLEYTDRVEAIRSTKELSDKQKQAQIDALDKLYGSFDQTGDVAASWKSIARKREMEAKLAQDSIAAMQDEAATFEALKSIATGRKEIAEIDQRILEIQANIERESLDQLIAEGKITDAAQARANLEARIAANKEVSRRDNASPLEKYKQEIEATNSNINDSFEQITVQGLDSFTDGLTDAIMGAKSLGDVFKGVAKQIIADLIRIAVKQLVVNSLLSSFGLGGGIPMSIGGSFQIGKVGGIGDGLPMSNGGSMTVGGRTGTDKNRLSLNGKPIARVSMGETISVIPKGMGGGNGRAQQSIYVDARGAVMNDQFAQMILQRANKYSDAGFVASYKQSMRDAPKSMSRANQYGE